MLKEKAFSALVELQWFIAEQVEEEKQPARSSRSSTWSRITRPRYWKISSTANECAGVEGATGGRKPGGAGSKSADDLPNDGLLRRGLQSATRRSGADGQISTGRPR